MRKATIFRQPSTNDGTPGKYISDSGLPLETIERPWLDNKPDVSCIPLGVYPAAWLWSKKHSCFLYHLQGVPGRTVIELHSANIYQQLLGCVAFGLERSFFKRDSIRIGCPDRDMQGVASSKEAMIKFHSDMCENGKQVPFELEIKNV